MSETTADAGEKVFHVECRCGEGTVAIPMQPDRYPILADDARYPANRDDARAELREKYGDWLGFETATGTCEHCQTTWVQATATAVARDRYAEDLEFHRPLTCPACHHRFSLAPQCYPTEDDVADKQLEPYTAAEVQQAGEEFYSLYMTKGVECRWNDHCEVDRFYLKGQLGSN